MIGLQAIHKSLDGEIPKTVDYNWWSISALPGIHLSTGCNSTNAFAGKGRKRALSGWWTQRDSLPRSSNLVDCGIYEKGITKS